MDPEPEEEGAYPEGESVNPEGESVNPEGESVNPDGESVNPEGEIVNPEGGSIYPEGEDVVSEDTVAEGEGIAEPSIADNIVMILLPSALLILALIIGLLIFSKVVQRKWRKPILKRKESKDSSTFQQDSDTQTFLDCNDESTLMTFKRFQNRPSSLLYLTIPSIFSLLGCPLMLLSRGWMTSTMWPTMTSQPNVNDMIACFLIPAGLVYAISFGFSLQEGCAKQLAVAQGMSAHYTCVRHAVITISQDDSMSNETKTTLLKKLKDEVIGLLKILINGNKLRIPDSQGIYGFLSVLFNPARDERVPSMSVVDISRPSSSDSLLRWLFLECLAFTSFFGILLVVASSPILEYCLCALTVTSISMFSFILADIDSPLHGIFRLSANSHLDMLEIMANIQRGCVGF